MSTRTRNRPQPAQAQAVEPPQPQPVTVAIPPAALQRLRAAYMAMAAAQERYQELAAAVAETLPLPNGRAQVDIEAGIVTLYPIEEGPEHAGQPAGA